MNYRPLDADVVYAGFWLRFVAYVIDVGIIILIALVIAVASSYGPAGPNFVAQEIPFFISAGQVELRIAGQFGAAFALAHYSPAGG